MRLRIVIIITLTVTAYVAVTLLWRQVFPFRDGIAEFLPEGTIAYAHVNLTSSVRRALRLYVDRVESAGSAGDPIFHGREKLGTALRAVLSARDVRELGLAWYQRDDLSERASELAFLIGQRASDRPDIIPATTIDMGGAEFRVIVVRVRADASAAVTAVPVLRDSIFWADRAQQFARRPVRAFLRPRLLPIPALDSVRSTLPGSLTASGTIGRRGFIVRSDHRLPLLSTPQHISLLVAPRAGSVHILGAPLRLLLVAIDAPTSHASLAALTAMASDAADIAVDPAGVAVRVPNVDFRDERMRDALRAIVARVWPTVQKRVLDGNPTDVVVADPSRLVWVPFGTDRWAIEQDGNRLVIIGTSRGGSVAATNESFLRDAFGSVSETALHIPRSCGPRSMGKGGILVVLPINPQFIVVLALNRDGTPLAFCGGNFRL